MANPNIDPQVAYLTPALYNAAQLSNLNIPQTNQLNQIASTVNLNKKLLSMNTNAAQKFYSQLDPHIKDSLTAMYGEASYIPKPKEGFAVRFGKEFLGAIASPFRDIFKAAGAYNRIINEPYLVFRQVQQGASIFDSNVWKKGWDGRQVFEDSAIKQLHQTYGDTDTFVAMKALQGLKPGEIIDAYGKVNNDIINSITKMLTKPDQWNPIMDQFKAAQVSPGRDLARILFDANPNDNKLYGSSGWQATSGTIDAVYQIVVDPLTWITGGTSKAVTKADKLAELLAKDPSNANIAKVFQDTRVRNTWDNVAGPLIKNLHDARVAGDNAAAVRARNEISRKMPDLNNDEILKMLSSSENKVFNADAAEKFFQKGEGIIEMLSGRVDGTTFYRTGIPIARRGMAIRSRMNELTGKFFNGDMTDEALNVSGKQLVKELAIRGMSGSNEELFLKQSDAAIAEMASTRRKIGRLAARFPLETEIGVLDRNVEKTLPTVRNLAKTIYPKAYADFIGEAFRNSDASDRVVLLRGLYMQIMQNMGLHAVPAGKELMERILQEKFADSTSFLSSKELDVAPQIADKIKSKAILEEQPAGVSGGLFKTAIDGPVHNYQGRPYIGNLPWHSNDGGISLSDFAFSVGNKSWVSPIVNSMRGTTTSMYTRKLQSLWSVLTLFPRLGIRSAIDEAFMYSMMAPGKDLLMYAKGRELSKAMTAFTGQAGNIPPIKRRILNLLGRNPAKLIGEEGRFKQLISGEDYMVLKSREEIANELDNVFEKVFTNEKDIALIKSAMIHNPEIINSMVNSMVAKSGIDKVLSGSDHIAPLHTDSELTRMMRELGLTLGGVFKEYTVQELKNISETALSSAHFKNWFLQFTKGKANFGEGFYNPGAFFVYHNALRTGEDFEKASNAILKHIGIESSEDGFKIANESALDKFLELSQKSAVDQIKGVSKIDSAVHRVEMQLLDMYNTFHGSALAFNDKLYDHIIQVADKLASARNEGLYGPSVVDISKAMDSINFSKFFDLTEGYRPEGKINTDLNFPKVDSNEARMQKMVNWIKESPTSAMEWMDAQNTHIMRQPVLWLTYVQLRKKYAQLESKWTKEYMAAHEGVSESLAKELADKRFTEIAINHAANNVLRFVDNPMVRSNLAWSLRTSGRFYRATEDFYRRVFRMKNVTPQVLYRLRLAHIGVDASGFLHPDQNGDPYLIMPADNIIFHAINQSMNVLNGNEQAVKQPMFNDFAVKIAMGNPSFQQDAGQPSLSGPFVAVPVLLMQKALRLWGGDFGKKTAEFADQAILGNVNQNLDWTQAIVPSTIKKVWDMLPKDDKDQQEVSAGMQAIAYNAAHGKFLTPEKLAQMPAKDRARAVSDYTDGIKVTAHNIIFMRAFLGLISPIAPTMQESRDVPDYLKEVGVNGLRPEFADILQSIQRQSRGEIQDPYGAALMTFTGKYPGRLVYTIARNEKAVNVMVNKTKETKDWILSNTKNIDKYGQAAFIFAPHIGAYDSNVYLWMHSSDMIKNRDLGDYLDEIMVAQERQRYYDIGNAVDQQLARTDLTASQRQFVIDQGRNLQRQMVYTNPLLEISLGSKNFGTGAQREMLANLEGIVSDDNFQMTNAVRKKLSTTIALVSKAIDSIDYINNNPDVVDVTATKQAIKQRTLEAIKEIGGARIKGAAQDPIIYEASRSVFIPLLNALVRDYRKAAPLG